MTVLVIVKIAIRSSLFVTVKCCKNKCFSDNIFRFASFYFEIGVKKGDVIHMLTRGDNLDFIFAVLGAWYLGAVPAFGDSTLSEEVLIEQVKFSNPITLA